MNPPVVDRPFSNFVAGARTMNSMNSLYTVSYRDPPRQNHARGRLDTLAGFGGPDDRIVQGNFKGMRKTMRKAHSTPQFESQKIKVQAKRVAKGRAIPFTI
jgi:hypothetical protein